MGDAGPSLRQLQRQFFELIRTPAGTGGGDLLGAVAGDRRASAILRVGIYADMYFLRLLDVLRQVFPLLAAALGDDRFSALARDYLQAHPSRHPSLRFLGDRLPGFMKEIARRRRHRGGPPAWAAELATLEWHRYDVFDRADVPLLTLDRLHRLAPEAFAGLPLRLIPAHHLLQSPVAVEAAWRALRQGQPAGSPPRQRRTLLIWRQGISVFHRPLAGLELRALRLVQGGTTLGLLCEEIGVAPEGGESPGPEAAAATAFNLLARWASDGLLQDAGSGVAP